MVSDAINAYFNFEWVIRAWDRGEDPICRKAPHLVVAYAHKDSLAAPTDAIIALSHLEIIAPSLGLGTCSGRVLPNGAVPLGAAAHGPGPAC